MEKQNNEIDSVAENLAHIVPILKRIFIKGLRTKTNLSPQTLYTLGALSYHSKLTMSGIGNHLSVPKPHVTALVDKLISEGLVERLSDERDRRIIYIQLTDKGKETFKEIKRMMTEAFRSDLSMFDEAKIHKMYECSLYIRDTLDEMAKSLQAGCCSGN
ncbi:MAG: MarR family transcriptional regulator [Bacteroidota bacterium]|nr:MarR family transcriptional regulator [Bacteroidota bacterium]